jgi:polar amino acid transport system substrate-binding protein
MLLRVWLKRIDAASLRVTVLVTVLIAAGCSAGGDSTSTGANTPSPRHVPLDVGVRDPVLQPVPSAPPCDPTRNLTPSAAMRPGAMPTGSTMRAIQDRGVLVVGVDQNTRMFSAPSTKDQTLEGFDIDLARQVAGAILGDRDAVRFEVIPPGRRLDVLESHTLPDGTVQKPAVDLVVDALTITCDRWQRVDFSAAYFADSLSLLVPKTSTATSLDDLAGEYVCASSNTTPERRIAASKAKLYQVSDRTDCLVALQEGRVAAAYTNRALLESLHEQDPELMVVGSAEKDERAAMAVPKGQTDFVRFLNGILEGIKRDGTWQAMYDKWFAKALDKADPPVTTYSG